MIDSFVQSQLVEVRSAGKKGRGVFALTDIAKDTVIERVPVIMLRVGEIYLCLLARPFDNDSSIGTLLRLAGPCPEEILFLLVSLPPSSLRCDPSQLISAAHICTLLCTPNNRILAKRGARRTKKPRK